MRLKLITLFIILLVILSQTEIALAQVESLETTVTHLFGNTIQFEALVHSNVPIKAAVIFFQADGDTRTNVGLSEVEGVGYHRYRLTYLHQISEYAIRPFSTVRYHWELTLADGDTYTSPVEYFIYTDNRFDWQVLEENEFRVHWYKGDLQFAQNLLDIAQEGKEKIHKILPLAESGNIEIYIYADSASLQAALNHGSESWVAGHADPDLGVILIALPDSPEQQLLARQRVPHELMHVLLYRGTGQGYSNLPVWLNEGLASMAELYPNPDYQILLKESADSGELLQIETLCNAFPREASNALLSYAEAQSFSNYLYNTFGASGFQSLITAYANGMDCESGAVQGVGQSLKQLERDWQRDVLSQNVAMKAFLNLSPWFVLLIVILIVPLFLVIMSLRAPEPQQQPE